jgi:hypothetical protein
MKRTCPDCGASFTPRPEQAGKVGRCRCGWRTTIPAALWDPPEGLARYFTPNRFGVEGMPTGRLGELRDFFAHLVELLPAAPAVEFVRAWERSFARVGHQGSASAAANYLLEEVAATSRPGVPTAVWGGGPAFCGSVQGPDGKHVEVFMVSLQVAPVDDSLPPSMVQQYKVYRLDTGEYLTNVRA